jgi:hypothetical protein
MDDTTHPFEHVDEGNTVRFVIDEKRSDDTHRGEIEEISVERDGDGGGWASAVIRTERDEVYHLEAQLDPRTGWSTPEVVHRAYLVDDTRFIERGALEEVVPIAPGVDAGELTFGDEVETWTGDRYRVVIAPGEREYDDKALAYNLDSRSNTLEKVDPADVLPARSEPTTQREASD